MNTDDENIYAKTAAAYHSANMEDKNRDANRAGDHPFANTTDENQNANHAEDHPFVNTENSNLIARHVEVLYYAKLLYAKQEVLKNTTVIACRAAFKFAPKYKC